MTEPAFYYHDLHNPDEVVLFTVPLSAVQCRDERVLVYDVRIGGGVLRHYAFADRWFTINCSLDNDGKFISEPGPIDWSFNCDFATPIIWRDDAVYQVDLELDVLVAADGQNHVVV